MSDTPPTDLLQYINATPALLSLLYDLDLMPEQLAVGSKDWMRMLQLAQWYRHTIATSASQASP